MTRNRALGVGAYIALTPIWLLASRCRARPARCRPGRPAAGGPGASCCGGLCVGVARGCCFCCCCCCSGDTCRQAQRVRHTRSGCPGDSGPGPSLPPAGPSRFQTEHHEVGAPAGAPSRASGTGPTAGGHTQWPDSETGIIMMIPNFKFELDACSSGSLLGYLTYLKRTLNCPWLPTLTVTVTVTGSGRPRPRSHLKSSSRVGFRRTSSWSRGLRVDGAFSVGSSVPGAVPVSAEVPPGTTAYYY
jgi:hypothetical protein